MTGVINNLTDGILYVNGSIIFSNAVFSLAVSSANIANNLIISNPSGNSFFLTSSNASINGTAFLTGSGNALYVSNNAVIGGNLSLTNIDIGSGVSQAKNNANASFVQANAANNLASSSYNQANAATNSAQAAFNKANVANNLAVTAADRANISLSTSSGGIVSTSNANWSSFNLGKQLIVSNPGGNPAIGITDSSGANIWATFINNGSYALTQMPDLNNSITAPNIRLTVSNTSFDITGNATVSLPGTTGNQVVNFSQFSPQSKNISGYTYLPGGILLQWGHVSPLAAGNSFVLTFPTKFPHTLWVFNPGAISDGGNANLPELSNIALDQITLTAIGATTEFGWFAIGN